MIHSSKLVFDKIDNPSVEKEEEKKVPPFKPLLEKEEETKKETKEENVALASLPLPTPLPSPLFLPAVEAIRPIAPLFEVMVQKMQVMIDKGIVETKVVLSAPQYANSPFFGTEIIIREYSTAPKIFNVELSAPSSTHALLEKNRTQLLNAIHGQGYKFRIYRLETILLDRQEQKEEKNSSENDKEGKE